MVVHNFQESEGQTHEERSKRDEERFMSMAGLASGLNHGLNQLKLNELMPLAGINSILPGLNWFKLVKTTGWHKSI